MRTAVTIDDALLAEVKLVATSTHQTVEAVVESAIRTVLQSSPAGRDLSTFPDGRSVRARLKNEDSSSVLLYDGF